MSDLIKFTLTALFIALIATGLSYYITSQSPVNNEGVCQQYFEEHGFPLRYYDSGVASQPLGLNIYCSPTNNQLEKVNLVADVLIWTIISSVLISVVDSRRRRA
ncbi:MAG TPA: hypothetical protein VMT23_02155 [Candidatus Binatia bacterium]|nr:hypothetical protein [Candidatus Binatia bacterium]